MHVPEGADIRVIMDEVQKRLGNTAELPLLGGIPRSTLLRSLRLDEITSALGATVVAAARDEDSLDVDVSKVHTSGFPVPSYY